MDEVELRNRILKALNDNVMLGTGSRDEWRDCVKMHGTAKKASKYYNKKSGECRDVYKKQVKKQKKLTEWQDCLKKYGREGAKDHYNKNKKRCDKLTEMQKEKMRMGADAYRERYRQYRDAGYSVEDSRNMAKSKKNMDEEFEMPNENEFIVTEQQISNMIKKIVHILDADDVRDRSIEEKIKLVHYYVFDVKHGGRHGIGMRKFKNTMRDIGNIAKTVAPIIPFII